MSDAGRPRDDWGTEEPSWYVRAIAPFLPEDLTSDVLERRPTELLAASILVGLLLLVGFSISQVFSGLYPLAATSAVVVCVLAGLLFWLRKGGLPGRVGLAFLSLAFIGQLTGALTTGGIHSFTLPSMALYPLFSFILLGRAQGLFWTWVVMSVLGVLFGLEIMDVQLPRTSDPDAIPIQILGNLLVLLAYGHTLVSWQLTTNALRQQALEKARREADVANRAKSRFLANMSHELRTPMNGVLGLAELTLGRAKLDAVDATTLATVLRSGRLMVTLLDDLLDFSRAEAGVVSFEAVPVHPAALVDQVHAMLAESARRGRVAVRTEVDPSVGYGLGDPARTRQVLTNLMGNAIKFAPKGEVQVRVRREGDAVHFEVQDTGIGIAPEAIERVFQPFIQADASTTRTHGGTGLGLAIARHLVENMGGTLTVESTQGEGSTFRFHLDMPPCEAPPEPVEPEATPAVSVEGLSVLVAEDNPVNREVVRRQLEALSVEAVLVQDGQEALAILSEQRFDAVLMDLHMPKIDGLEAARRAREAGYEDAIIAMTASALPEDRQAALDAGMEDVLVKPVTLEGLRVMLARTREASQR